MAYNVSCSQKLNNLWNASFCLALNDRKRKHCHEGMYVHIKDKNEDYGLYQIDKIEDKLSDKSESIFTCSHVLSKLLFNSLTGQTQVGGTFSSDPCIFYTRDVLEFVLSKQTTKFWKLGDCDFNFEYEYLFEESTLLSALFAIVEPIVSPYHWVWDTTTAPWTLHLKKLEPSTADKCRFINSKNIKDITRVIDSSNLFTRITPLGYGEGVNQLRIGSENNGIDYLQAPSDSIQKYGIRDYIWIDRGYQNAKSLKESAQKLLELGQVPKETISFSAIDLSLITNKEIDRPRIGKYARIIHPEGAIDQNHYITEITRNNVEERTGEVAITLANTPEDIVKTLSNIQNKLYIEQSCAQGATFFWQNEKSENIDAAHPLRFQVYIPPQARNINSVNLRYFFEAFRADVHAIASTPTTLVTTNNSPSSTQTSSSGGGTYSSTSAGGNYSSSTAAGGGDYLTSGSSNSNSTRGGAGYTNVTQVLTGHASGSSLHQHDMSTIHYYIQESVSNHTHGMEHYHALNLPTHSHAFSLPTHTHALSINPHTHTMTIPAHDHTVLLGSHTHAMLYGIFEGLKASAATLRINKTQVSIPENTDIDIVTYMEKNSDGTLKRGTHIIEIIPNRLTRITATISPQVFAQPNTGGVY